MGGWILSSRPAALGLDLEVEERVTPALVQRICKPEELRAAPNPAAIWVVKEAGFKAFSSLQPQLKTMSQVETSQWIPLKSDWWVCKASTPPASSAQALCGRLAKNLYLAVIASVQKNSP
jgi:hypothetical protein